MLCYVMLLQDRDRRPDQYEDEYHPKYIRAGVSTLNVSIKSKIPDMECLRVMRKLEASRDTHQMTQIFRSNCKNYIFAI